MGEIPSKGQKLDLRVQSVKKLEFLWLLDVEGDFHVVAGVLGFEERAGFDEVYAVKDGAVVYAGDPVAVVDTISVYKLIASLGEELDKITEQIRKRFKEPWFMNGKELKIASPNCIIFHEITK